MSFDYETLYSDTLLALRAVDLSNKELRQQIDRYTAAVKDLLKTSATGDGWSREHLLARERAVALLRENGVAWEGE